jgi:short subunit dehydrogenase-like uncharacterized protein
MTGERYDLVLYGATGFTGRQAARYLAAHAPEGLRFAVAGRRREALEALRAEVGAHGVLVAHAGDAAAVGAMVARARVLASTAGPFARYGTHVFQACAGQGVDYVDITGETPWVRQMIDRWHEPAARAGTRLVPFCGVDSVPADLGTLLVASELRRRYGQPTRRVSASFVMRTGLNGGTLDSALGLQDPAARAAFRDVLLLNPSGRATDAERERSADLKGVRWDPVRQAWLGPYLMAATDTRVVRRSNALMAEYGAPYGAEFTYEEAAEYGGRLAAQAFALGLRAAEVLLTSRAGAWLARRLGPKPGEGPSEEVMARGFLRARFLGEAEDGRQLLATIAADGDPANRLTVTALVEAALALAGSRAGLPGRGGVLTPATGIGLDLLERLKTAGWRVSVAPVG